MTHLYRNLISAANLQSLYDDAPSNLTVLDCRAKLGQPEWGRQQFHINHLPQAQYADLDRDLAIAANQHGRHPLPERQAWLSCVRRWGIENHHQVVVYDDAGGAFAARAWWMLRWLGHEAVAVLDGGLAAWSGALEEGEARPVIASQYAEGTSLTKLITVDQLLDRLDDTHVSLVDARTQARWSGQEEPIDPIAGHIPGAVCRPFQDNLDERGYFKSADQLRQRFADLGPLAVHYCGSGVTATHNVLAMHIAGLDEPVLYADSWSGWITDPSRPIART